MSCKGKTGADLKACQKAAKDRLAKQASKVTSAVVGEFQKVRGFFKKIAKKVQGDPVKKKNRREAGKRRRAVRKNRRRGSDTNHIN
tara:strand:- start:56 stop:313 length:258 start_codon:yes stop_codon:yes gene_type:complete